MSVMVNNKVRLRRAFGLIALVLAGCADGSPPGAVDPSDGPGHSNSQTGVAEVSIFVWYTAPGDTCARYEVRIVDAAYWSDYAVDPVTGKFIAEVECEDITWTLSGDDGSCWEIPFRCGEDPSLPFSDPFFTRDPNDPTVTFASCGLPACK